MSERYKITDAMIDEAAIAVSQELKKRGVDTCFLAETDSDGRGEYEFQRNDGAPIFNSDAHLHFSVVDGLPDAIRGGRCTPAIAALLIDKICEVQMLRSKVKNLPPNISLTGEQVCRMAQLFNDVNDMELGGITMNLTQNERGSIFVDITVRQFEVEP